MLKKIKEEKRRKNNFADEDVRTLFEIIRKKIPLSN